MDGGGRCKKTLLWDTPRPPSVFGVTVRLLLGPNPDLLSGLSRNPPRSDPDDDGTRSPFPNRDSTSLSTRRQKRPGGSATRDRVLPGTWGS